MHNLLQNAQDATMQARAEGKETEPFVRISTRLSESSGRVRLSISDSGTGFPPHILQRAFEPYVTTKARGTGLGLAVVKRSPTSMAPALICPTAWKTASCAARKCRYHLPQKPRWCLSHPPHNSCGLC